MCNVHQYDEFYRPAFFRVIRIITLDCQLRQNKKKSGNKTKMITQQQFDNYLFL